MSSLLASYNKLTDRTNQGVFDNTELHLSLGRAYAGTSNDNVFTTSGGTQVIDFVIQAGADAIGIDRISFVSDSELFTVQFYGGVQHSGGTPMLLTNQLVGSPRLPLTNILMNPSISDLGTTGTEYIVRGESGGKNDTRLAGGGTSALIIIAPGVNALLRLTNNGSNGILDIGIIFAELATD